MDPSKGLTRSIRFAATIMPTSARQELDTTARLAVSRAAIGSSLVRSKAAATPEDGLSDDFSAEFATLPIHLSFQRMLEMIRATQPEDATLARSVGELQDRARALQDTVTPEEWSRIVAAAASPNGPNGGPSSDISALLEAARTVDQPQSSWPDGKSLENTSAGRAGAAPAAGALAAAAPPNEILSGTNLLLAK